MANIVRIDPDSLAARKGITSGDKIIRINGQPVRDYIDYLYLTADEEFEILYKKRDGSLEKVLIERKPEDNLGINLDGIIYDHLKSCQNKCIFCFIDQQPDDLRHSLLLKDDDYRFSFLQGSFITLTNLTKEELKRIIDLKLSPLNISVHTTNPDLRIKMMRNKNAGKILELLSQLAKNGIEFNTQIVLCPEINDGQELDRTINDLLKFYPELISIGVVPVGLTRYRKNLVQLNSFERESSYKVLKQLKRWQKEIKKEYGENILYAADEFYLTTGENIPAYHEYHGFPQLENGIGLTRLLWNELKEIEPLLPEQIKEMNIGLITGKLGELALRPVIERFRKIKGLNISLLTLKNNFFGDSVTVTGLITGQDIIEGLNKLNIIPERVIIPAVMVNDDNLFLDNLKIGDIQNHFPDTVFNICNNLKELVEVI
jgi:putative radical SAM enzyme (TIGR03279 family)